MGRTATDTKATLIETAKDLIWQNSYASVSVDDICNAAGAKKGSFYHYFPSKVELAIAALDDHFKETKTIFDDVFSPTRPAYERFELLAHAAIENQRMTLEKYGKVCGCPFATLGSEMAGQEDKISEKIIGFVHLMQRYYETTLRDLVSEGHLPKNTNIQDKAEDIATYIIGQFMMARVNNSLEHLERTMKSGLFRIIGIQEKLKKTA